MLEVARAVRLVRPRAGAARAFAAAWATAETVVLLGRNGAGKSTTLKAIAGLLRPVRGEMRVRRRAHRGARLVAHRAPGPGLRAGGAAHLHRSHRHGEPAGRDDSRRAPACRNGPSSAWSRCSPTWPSSRAPARRADLRRRATDADDRAHADGQPHADPARRAHRGAGAGDRRADGRGPARAQARRGGGAAVGAEPALRRRGRRSRLRHRKRAIALRRRPWRCFARDAAARAQLLGIVD